MIMPIGDCYKGGLAKPVDGLIVEGYDRVLVVGNHSPFCLYLDALTHTKVEEFSTSNFIGIGNTKKRYVAPKNPLVLPSISNKSL